MTSSPTVSASPHLTLPDGGRFPTIGLGMWKMPKPELPGLVREAIRLGDFKLRHNHAAVDDQEVAIARGQTLLVDIQRRR